MSEMLILAGVFTGSLIVGYALISRVPQMLHTPLMSMTNAISAVTILGGLLLFASATGVVETAIGAVALAAAAFNVVGGFAVTDRMLQLFKRR